uniref:Small ribosomal subunit protein mS23 n=1 Tax=Syphacia muris TaxID=451379 RepID=A0A0N5APW3_9BILA
MAAQLVRKENVGSIFYRVTGLLRGNQMKWNQRPLWYDIYAMYPPLLDTGWNAKFPKEKEPVNSILYAEDVVRAEFYKKIRSLGAISVENLETISLSQFFVDIYSELETQNPKLEPQQLFDMAVKEVEKKGIELNIERNKVSEIKNSNSS